MAPETMKRWAFVHKWSSLVCTAFLLVICVTGLPLIFISEINDAFTPTHDAPARAGDASSVSVDHMIATGRALYPGQFVTNFSFDDDAPQAFMGMVPSFPAAKANPRLYHWIKFDTRTGEVINTSERFQRESKAVGPAAKDAFIRTMLALHVDLYARLPGNIFLAFMAFLFVVALVSGVVLYGPFTRKLDFGAVRTRRSRRLKWLDLHNLLGVVTLVWCLIVGVTGILNELAGPINDVWIHSDVERIFAPWHGRPMPRQNEMSSAQAAFDTARRALPGMGVNYMSFPNPLSENRYHYWLWGRGNTHLTENLSTAVFIDARTGKLTRTMPMPWYQRAVELSRPLHFGNYGGLPLKIIWALFDIVTIVVLASGLYLWFFRRQQRSAPEEGAVIASRQGACDLQAAE